MLVNTILMLVYVTKFFWWEAGYWNTMDIAHDRGSHMLYLSIFVPLFGVNSRWMLVRPTLSVNVDLNEEISRGHVYTFLDTL